MYVHILSYNLLNLCCIIFFNIQNLISNIPILSLLNTDTCGGKNIFKMR